MQTLKGIDRFYVILGIVLLVLTIPMIFAVKSIFSAFLVAYEIKDTGSVLTRIDKGVLDESVSKVYDKSVEDFTIRETRISLEDNTNTQQ